ncbi:hypothetical protein X975_11121, partial [Stegodyphus mimosarum]
MGLFSGMSCHYALAGASGTFQREMTKALSCYSDFAQVHIDDIFFKHVQQHLKHLEMISKQLENLSFSETLLVILQLWNGLHKIRNSNHGLDPSNIKQLDSPQNTKGVHLILCLMGFIAHISKLCRDSWTLTDLMRKNEPNAVQYGLLKERAFKKLKDILCQVTSFIMPDFNFPLQTHLEALEFVVSSSPALRCMKKAF